MAHFAELDDNNNVLRVIVISDQDMTDINGIESEEIGQGFCKKLFGTDTHWKQTSYNKTIRTHFAGPGFTYDGELNAFIPPRPFPSWTLNTETVDWEPPIQEPENLKGQLHYWDEDAYQADNTTGWVVETVE
tara:strand:- start:678 stop:1073 length:396 start_codon:yes stop_codon:yes gene_type:complete